MTQHGVSAPIGPPVGEDLPTNGFDCGDIRFAPAPGERAIGPISISPTSQRLQLLSPFPAWTGEDYIQLPVLLKATGKCTTDQISPAGPWLQYRGHLENMSGNLFLGVVNAFSGATGEGTDPFDGEVRPFPDIAKRLGTAGVQWCAVGDENYGEGSSREHAAMEPRYRGCLAILAPSFARIHETNLKKQGILPLTFVDPAIYEAIDEDDRISIFDLASLEPDELIRCRITKADAPIDFECQHTFSADQVAWFRAGSALNAIRARRAATA